MTLINHDLTADLIHGAMELEHGAAGLVPHRLPAWARARNDDPNLAMAESQASGVRLAFRTSASRVVLHALPTRRSYTGMPARQSGVYDLLVDGVLDQQQVSMGGNVLHIAFSPPSMTLEQGGAQDIGFDGLPSGQKTVEIWLPHDETIELVGLSADAGIVPVPPQGRRWLHHGSSISQGSNAASPSGIWPAVAARAAGLDLVNLGFSGSALLDPFVARAMRDAPAELISVKMGINLVNADLMRMRAFGPALDGFLDTIREGHETTPLMVISSVYCPIHENTPGPGQFDLAALAEGRVAFIAEGREEDVARGRLSLVTIRQKMAEIVARRAEADPNIFYLDGLDLYGPADHERLPLPDRLHPDGPAHHLIGERFAAMPFLRR